MSVPLRSPRLWRTRPGPPARLALAAAVAELQVDDPLAPVTVITPTNLAGLSLRRWLGSRPPGIVNVRFLVLDRVAELLAAASMAAQGRRPLDPALRQHLVAASLHQAPGRFAGMLGQAATLEAVETALHELDELVELDQVDDEAMAVVRRTRGGADLLAVRRRYREATVGWYEAGDLRREAVRLVRAGQAPSADLGGIVLYAPRRITPSAADLAVALTESHPARVVLTFTGEAAADRTSRAWAERFARSELAADTAPSRPGAPPETEIASLPTSLDEVRFAVSRLAEALDRGVPLHRCAVACTDTAGSVPALRDELAAAGMACSGRATTTLAQSVAGRTVMAALDVVAGGWLRTDVERLLLGAPIVDRSRLPIPSGSWLRTARRAGIVRGLAQWHDRLDALTEQGTNVFAARPDVGRGHDEPPEPLVPSRTAARAAALHEFVRDLESLLVQPVVGWPAAASYAVAVLRTLLHPDGRWPDHEVDAFARVTEQLQALSLLGDVDDREVTLEGLRAAVLRAFDQPSGRMGRSGHGVLIGSWRDVIDQDLDLLIVIGLREGVAPARADVGSLLPDATRVRLAGAVPTAASKAGDERSEFLAALAAAPRHVLTFARADPGTGRALVPAPWLVERAGTLAGRPVDAQALFELTDAPWLVHIPSSEALGAGIGAGRSSTARRRGALAGHVRAGGDVGTHPLANERLRRGTKAVRDRASVVFTEWDGHVGPLEGLGIERTVLSPTSLERYAACPARYLFEHVYGLREPDVPGETQTIDPRTRGSLVHHVLETLVVEGLAPAAPEVPWSADAHARAHELAADALARVEAAGLTGRGLAWSIEQRRIRRDLERTLVEDDVARAGRASVTIDVEMAFGLGGQPPAELVLPDGRTLQFKGFVDRVDRNPVDGALTVIDYKTGSPTTDEKLRDELRRGLKLQLPIYGLAARQRHGGPAVRSGYWYVGERAGWRYAALDLDEVHIDFERAVTMIADNIAGGVFPARPGAPAWTSFENCRYCPFDVICPSDRDRSWARLGADPLVQGFMALAEPTGEEPYDG